MSAPTFISVLRQLSGHETRSDPQLLECFVRERDEAAFAELTRRHGPLVWGACRRVLARPQDAEDVFQATFLVLARKAALIGWHESVGGWLHAVAHRLARKAQCDLARRHSRERQGAMPARTDPGPDPSWREVGALLDEELERLPQRLRDPLLLCYLEGRTRDEAARQLGWSLGTLKRRLERGRKLLRVRLTRRGVSLAAVMLAGTLAPCPVQARLNALAVRAARAWSAGRSAAALGISARVSALAESAARTLMLGTAKTVVAFVVMLGLLAGLVGALAWTAPPPEPGRPPRANQTEKAKPREKSPTRVGGEKEAKTQAAIAEGLQWLARHQAPDGHWSLNAFDGDGHCNCTGRGTHNDVAGTAFGLLPLLGAGMTHKSPGPFYRPYADPVRRGLDYLRHVENDKGDFGQGMYAHALATLTLCEAYGLTTDAGLKEPAQRAVDYIVAAQHPTNGGWRYRPLDPAGDTSVTGWQVLALASARHAGLKVPRETWQRTAVFLESVASDDGSAYGYTSPGLGSPAMTAAGLFCRLQLGWKPTNPSLVKGVAHLQAIPPSPATPNLYYYHYATRVMEGVGGKDWEQWESRLRQLLLQTQDRGDDPKHAHQKGSWSPDRDLFGKAGGRVMITSLALILLESCARHDPPVPPPAPRALKPEEIEARWRDLAGEDVPQAQRSLRILAAGGRPVVEFLKGHLKPVPAVDRQRIEQWVAQLDDEEFTVRDRATAELTRLGDLAGPALQEALDGKPSLEVRRRVEGILKAVRRQESAPDRLQTLRAVEVLADMSRNTAEARRLLRTLARGAPESRVTRAAQAGLEQPTAGPR